MNLFRVGNFRLASGQFGRWKIDCEALTRPDWEALAFMLAEQVGPFGSALGVPSGGLELARCLRPHATAGPLLVVDDVWTTGGSMRRFIGGLGLPADADVTRAVVFARGPLEPGVVALFRMPNA